MDLWDSLSTTGSALDDALEDLSKILSEPVSIPNADGSYGYMGNWEAPTYDGYDWATHLRGVREVYRGVGIPLSPEDQEWFANGGNRGSTEQTAEYVLSLVEKHRSPGVGLHWTSHRGEAAGFAGMTADRGGLRVILTAQTPSADQVMTGDELKGQGFFGPSDGEQEVPVKKGTPMRITKVEWALGGPRPMMRSDDGGGWMGASPNGTKTVMASKTASGALDDWWDMSGDEPRWVQPRAELLKDALYEWKGSNSSLAIHMNHILAGDPPDRNSNGTAKIWRAQAQAIIEEVRNGKSIPRLYRGDTRQPVGFLGWSENLRTARRFAKMGGGQVWVLTEGSARGIKIDDYAPGSGLDYEEREWIVETTGQAQPMQGVD